MATGNRAGAPRHPNYAVLVKSSLDGVELTVRELLLVARTPTFQEAYDRLLEQWRNIADWALAADMVADLPPAEPLPPLREG